MIINKRIALFMVILNFLFSVYYAAKFLLFNQSIFEDFLRQPLAITNGDMVLFVVIPGAAAIVIYIGLFWLMRNFNEPKWLQSGLIVIFVCRLITFLLPLFTVFFHWDATYLRIGGYLTNFSLLYIAFTFAFVRAHSIRKYYRAFAGLMFFCLAYNYAAPVLYNSGYHWKFVNQELLFSLPFLASLMLFFDVYHLSHKICGNVEEVPVNTGY